MTAFLVNVSNPGLSARSWGTNVSNIQKAFNESAKIESSKYHSNGLWVVEGAKETTADEVKNLAVNSLAVIAATTESFLPDIGMWRVIDRRPVKVSVSAL